VFTGANASVVDDEAYITFPIAGTEDGIVSVLATPLEARHVGPMHTCVLPVTVVAVTVLNVGVVEIDRTGVAPPVDERGAVAPTLVTLPAVFGTHEVVPAPSVLRTNPLDPALGGKRVVRSTARPAADKKVCRNVLAALFNEIPASERMTGADVNDLTPLRVCAPSVITKSAVPTAGIVAVPPPDAATVFVPTISDDTVGVAKVGLDVVAIDWGRPKIGLAAVPVIITWFTVPVVVNTAVHAVAALSRPSWSTSTLHIKLGNTLLRSGNAGFGESPTVGPDTTIG
jgi:hypothetical protein